MCVLALLPIQGNYFTGTTKISFDHLGDWQTVWGHYGPQSVNWNAYLMDMKIKVIANSDDIFITGYNQSIADKVWENVFTTAFSKLKQ
jgi:hypothetical protein